MDEGKNKNNGNLNVQFFVDGKKVDPRKNHKLKSVKRLPQELSKEKIKKLSEFPKVEPESEVRRLSGRIIYNISVPGVKDINDIFINQLENSVEVKALGKDKVYSKTLKLNLPVKGYDLIKDNLVLEFDER
jgi:HSP20 family molecular chaperone IbpA